MAVVAALTALGNAAPQLKVHINGAINVGCSIEELVEIMIQMSVYCGFPAAINGITVLKEVIYERNIKFNPISQNSEENRFKVGSRMVRKIGRRSYSGIKGKIRSHSPRYGKLYYWACLWLSVSTEKILKPVFAKLPP